MSSRATPFVATMFTDANVDHTAGLGELRQEPGPIAVVSTPVVRSLLVEQPAYERFDRTPQRWLAFDPGENDIAPCIDESIAGPGKGPAIAELAAKGSGLRQRVRDFQQRLQQLDQTERDLSRGREILAR